MNNHSNYRLLVLIAGLQGFVFYAPVATLYRRAYGLDIQGLFLIESISWLATLALEAPWGRFADRFGYRLTMILGTALFLVSKVVFAVALGFGGFLAERLVLSLALSALSGCTEAMLYRSVSTADAARAFGRWHASGRVGLFLASLAAPLLYTASMRLAAYGTIVPYAAALVCSLLLIDVPRVPAESESTAGRAHREGARSALIALLRDRGLLLFLIAAAVLTEAAQSATVFLAPLQYQRAGVPATMYGVLFALTQASGMAAAASGRAITAIGRRRFYGMLLTVSVFSLAALSASASATISIVALLALAAATSAFGPLSSIIQNEKAIDASRATMLSINAIVMELIAAIINTGVGHAAALGLSLAFGVLASMVAVMLFVGMGIFTNRSGV